MPTINQLIKKPRRALPRINKVKDLEASPQKRGVCLQVKTEGEGFGGATCDLDGHRRQDQARAHLARSATVA